MRAALGILLSGSGSTYENLHEHIAAGRLPARVVVVVASRAGCGGIARAERLGHPVVVASRPEAVNEALRSHGAEWVAMCGWLKFWDPPADFAGRVLNVHPSLLPAHGGRGMYGQHVHAAVLAAGDSESGCTVHEVRGAYDSGPVLAQQRVPVLPDDTPSSLQSRVQAAERELYPRVLAERISAAASG